MVPGYYLCRIKNIISSNLFINLMSNLPIIECVPNFSEGRDQAIIDQIAAAIASVEGVELLNVDPGKATNRTVVTFAGTPQAVVEAAFRGIKTAQTLIDMRQHKGEHPRMGATDVCPFVPISNATLADCVACANALAQKVANELQIPIYLYEAAAKHPDRKNLANIRAGEYEGLPEKLIHPDWAPDFGPKIWNESIAKSGATVIGARPFLIAYNINLNTTSTRRANSVAFDVREAGRVLREGNPITGKIITDSEGNPIRQPGALKGVKAIGWFIEEYGIAQISMNLTDIETSPLHLAFDEVCESADRRGLRVTGSEIVGLVPLQAMLAAGKYFLRKQQRSVGVDDAELVRIAIKSLGLAELAPFNPDERIVEYVLAKNEKRPLVNLTLQQFTNETASDSPAPGGGSVAALAGALGVALATMVANLSSHKRGWDERWEYFSDWAEKGQAIKTELLKLVDDDTASFNVLLEAMRMPKNTPEEKAARAAAIQNATLGAIDVPMRTLELATNSMEIIAAMVEQGMSSSISDAATGAACARAAATGAYLNVCTNAQGLTNMEVRQNLMQKAQNLFHTATHTETEIFNKVMAKMQG